MSCNLSDSPESSYGLGIVLNLSRADLDVATIDITVEAEDMDTVQSSNSGLSSITVPVPYGNDRLFSVEVTLDNGSILSGTALTDISVNDTSLVIDIEYDFKAVTDISISSTIPSVLGVGSTYQMSAEPTPTNASDLSVTWSSNDTSIATVSSTGYVTVLATGSVTITATSSDSSIVASQTLTITDVSIVPVTDISITNTAPTSVGVDSTYQMSAEVTPVDATDQSITWSSNDTSIATVDSTGLVTGLTLGDITITATSSNGLTATQDFTIAELPDFAGIWYTYTGEILNVLELTETDATVKNIEYTETTEDYYTITYDEDSITLTLSSVTADDGTVTEYDSSDKESVIMFWAIEDGNLLFSQGSESSYYYTTYFYSGEPESYDLVNPDENYIFHIDDYYSDGTNFIMNLYNAEGDTTTLSTSTISYEGAKKQYYIAMDDTLDINWVTAGVVDSDGYCLAYMGEDTSYEYNFYVYNMIPYIYSSGDSIYSIDDVVEGTDLVSEYIYFDDELTGNVYDFEFRNDIEITSSFTSIPTDSTLTTFTLTDYSTYYEDGYVYSFTPDVAGEYYITFTVDDGFNTAEEDVVVTVMDTDQGVLDVSFE